MFKKNARLGAGKAALSALSLLTEKLGQIFQCVAWRWTLNNSLPKTPAMILQMHLPKA